MSSSNEAIRELAQQEYKWGFVTDIGEDRAPKGLSEEIIRFISAKKNEPEFMLEWRLKAFRYWMTLEKTHAEPKWANIHYPPIDYQAISYYSAPKQKPSLNSLDELDPEILRTYEKLGIPLAEQKMLAGVAVDAVFDSVSVATTFKGKLSEVGVIFCSFSEAVQKHPDLVKKYLGSVVPHTDNFFAALNAAVFTDGSFVYVPKGVKCPMELSTYFRINAAETGQFERTLIIADEGASVSYLEGCTAPIRDENQLHAAVVELIALDDAQIKYSTVQNWYPGDKNGKGGIYNFVTKRGACRGKNSKMCIRDRAFIAREVIGISPCAVTNMIGIRIPVFSSSSWNSSPLIPGSRTSSTRQLGTCGRGALTNSSVEPNTSARSPTDFSRLFTASRMDASSSTTNTIESDWTVGIYDSMGMVN